MIKIKRLDKKTKMPEKAYNGDAGLDLFSNQITTKIKPGEHILISTGIAIQLPDLGNEFDIYGRIAPRSGLAMEYGLHTLAGVIDRSYSGEIKINLINLGEKIITIKRGDKIAQLIPTVIYRRGLMEVQELDKTDRGDDGHGSTGK